MERRLVKATLMIVGIFLIITFVLSVASVLILMPYLLVTQPLVMYPTIVMVGLVLLQVWIRPMLYDKFNGDRQEKQPSGRIKERKIRGS